MRFPTLLQSLLLAASVGVTSTSSDDAWAEKAGPPARTEDTREAPARWHAEKPDIGRDVAAGKPLVVQVFVPLCSNDQIDCGAGWAGQAGRLETNLYWGAIFGARRIFERKRSGWKRVELTQGGPKNLERAIYRRFVPAKAWGLERDEPVEQLVVLQAIHGDEINHAVKELWSTATRGGSVEFLDGKKKRRVRVHVAGYAGHNRLMDGVKLPKPPKKPSKAARPSFVLACYSESYFAKHLTRAGSKPLVTTRALMAPEGYLIDALAQGLGDNLSESELNERVVRSYAKWQRISHGTAKRVFQPR